jgi:hypothetical protein
VRAPVWAADRIAFRARACGQRLAPLDPRVGFLRRSDDGEKYYALLVERVGALVKAGKSLDDIKKEVKMPEYAHWASQDRMPTNIDAAYRMVNGK